MSSSLWDTVEYRHNIVKLLKEREIKNETGKILSGHFQFTGPMLQRLGLEKQLEGHEGCVNCLQWSTDGKYVFE